MKTVYILLYFLLLSVVVAAGPKQEIRAVWLTANYGLDWPSNPARTNSDVLLQKKELDNILDQLQSINMNVVFIQARLRGSVIYPSKIEPVSAYVKSRSYSNSDYDLLAYAVQACHKRGMECHAWFVTYPLGSSVKALSPELKKKKHLIKTFNKELYLDPGSPETDSYLLKLIVELVNNYDIDGFHFDYVRYPDKASRFPDEDTYKKYGRNRTKADWRRENINRFTYAAYDTIKAIKPWVQVSSSVVGMYTKIGSPKSHWTAFHDAFQDPVDWLEKGKHDFIVPMMYYSGELFFPFVTDWVSRSNGRLVVPGLGLYQMDEKEMNWPGETIVDQIRHSREEQTHGNAFYRSRYLTKNKKGIRDKVEVLYSTPALLPPLTWLSDSIPPSPEAFEVTSGEDRIRLRWEQSVKSEGMIFYNLYRSSEFPVDTSNAELLFATRLTGSQHEIPLDNSVVEGYYYAVTSYDRYHNESEASPPVYLVTGISEK